MADDCFVEEPSFAVHSPLPIKGMGRILSIRYQDACIDDFSPEDIRLVGNEGSSDPAALDPACPVTVVFIERAAEDGLATITHAYTPVPAVSQYLTSTRDVILAEDAAFLTFLIAGGSDATSSLLLRSGFHKRLKPVHEENRRLAAELKALRLENARLKAGCASGGPSRNGAPTTADGGTLFSTNSNNVSPLRRSATPEGGGVFDQQPNANSSSNTHAKRSDSRLNRTNDDSAIGVHSPHLWETETEAAVNARTRYQPYKDEASKAKQRRARHTESVQQLVARLHDKSCDDRDARLASYDDVIRQENERYSERKTLSLEEQQALGARLHDLSTTQKKKKLEELEKQVYPPEERRTFDSEAIAASNDRIYRQPMDKKKKDMEKLLQTYVYEPEAKLPKVKLGKEQQQAMADRLSQRHR